MYKKSTETGHDIFFKWFNSEWKLKSFFVKYKSNKAEPPPNYEQPLKSLVLAARFRTLHQYIYIKICDC